MNTPEPRNRIVLLMAVSAARQSYSFVLKRPTGLGTGRGLCMNRLVQQMSILPKWVGSFSRELLLFCGGGSTADFSPYAASGGLRPQIITTLALANRPDAAALGAMLCRQQPLDSVAALKAGCTST